MYNFTTFLKAVLCSVFIFSSVSIALACPSLDDITRDFGTDNLDGTTIYNVAFFFAGVVNPGDYVKITTTAGSTITNCNGGDCNDFDGASITPGANLVSAVVTIPTGTEIQIFVQIFENGTTTVCESLIVEFPSIVVALPAELVAFSGKAKDRVNSLEWQTASEENTMAFQMERSLDGRNFEIIGKVEASGFSNDLRTYEFVDDSPSSLSYYRLQIVDLDGSFEYSDVLTIERTKPEIDLIEVFPVPVVGNDITVLVHSKGNGTIFLDLFDMTGRIVQQDRLDLSTGINRIELGLDNEANNMYFLTIYNGDERMSKTILRSNLD